MQFALAVFKVNVSSIIAGLAMIIAVISVIKFGNIIKKLRTRQQRLQKDKEQYRVMLENADDGILIIQRLKFRYANKKAYEIMGLPQDRGVSNNLVDYIYPDDLNIVLDNYEKTMLSNDRETSFKVRLIKKDQSILWVHIRLVPVVWDYEPADLCFMRDITCQKMMEQNLQQTQRMEAIGALAGGIAHEFNNILTTIVGTAELVLMDCPEDQPGKDEFKQIQESGYRARDLARQILTITRENVMDAQPLYLSPIIKEALKLLRSTLPKNIKIIKHIDQQLDVVKADSIQMYQVFMNLCTNAKHALEKTDSPCIEVALKNVTIRTPGKDIANDLKPGKYVELSVRDNGAGIANDIAHKIFKPYFTTKDKNSGAGLGLSTTLEIVKQFDGYIFFESEPGKGTCFTVYLPVHEMGKSKDRVSDKKAPVQGGGKILFVDDEQEITLIAKKMFESLGFSVMALNSGKQALEYFARSPEFFDLMITDMAMPEMTGEKLAKEVMRIRPGFPVIMCTGHSDTFDEKKAKESGIREYITKPYNLKRLSSVALKYIKKSRAA